MSIIIKGIYNIDPTSVEFSADGTEDGDIVHPEKAYEILTVVNDKKFETYGVIWIIEDQPHAFIDEDFEAFLLREFKDRIEQSHIESLNQLIFNKYNQQDFELPFTVL